MTFLERFKDTTVFTEQSTGVTKLCGIRSQTEEQEFVAHGSGKVWTKIWQVLYCVTWNTFLRFLIPERKTLQKLAGVGR